MSADAAKSTIAEIAYLTVGIKANVRPANT
jgi:hypothetical protein